MKKTLLITLFAMFAAGNLFSQNSLPLCFRYDWNLTNSCPITVCIDVEYDGGTPNAHIVRMCHTFNYLDEYCFGADLPISIPPPTVLGAQISTSNGGGYVTFTPVGGQGSTPLSTGCLGGNSFIRIYWNSTTGFYNFGTDLIPGTGD